MSINITVHGNHVAPTNDINCFRDLQTLRKETFAKKRISRIKQVREQSKDVASRLRRRVHNEEEKQLFRIRDTQENELKSWKERHIKKLKDHYESRLNTFGEAHLNAEREKQAEKMAEERALAQATAARKRRKSAALKLKDCHFKALPKVVMKLPASPNKNVATQADLEIKAKVPAYEELELPPSNSVIDLSSDDSSILNFQPNRSSYDPANYAGDSTSESISIVFPATQDPLFRQPFTQVSDFLKKRQWERQLENLQDTNQQPNKSPVKISKPTDQQQQKKVVRSPVKSTLPSKSSLKGKENLSKKSLKSSTTPTIKPTVPKVTYYDHTTRFTKEYDMPGNLVVRNAPTAGEQNAYEAASDLKRVEQEERAAEQRKRATTELDPTFRNGLKLLHSSKSDSAEKLRNALDELIKTKFGSTKMLINTLSKKHLAEEAKSTGSNLSVKPKPLVDQKKLTNLTVATGSPTIEGISVASSQSPTILSDIDQVQEELMELLCVVCRRMDNSAKNCLVECCVCHSLYHQDCHKPHISETDANDPEHSWLCSSCRNKDTLIEIDSSIESPSKSSTSSDSTRHKKKKEKFYDSSSSDSSESVKVVKKSSHSGSHKKSSSSREGGNRDGDSRSSSDSRDRSHSKSSGSGAAAASGSSSSVTPSINIVSADKRLQNMKKKAAKMHETKRKHK